MEIIRFDGIYVYWDENEDGKAKDEILQFFPNNHLMLYELDRSYFSRSPQPIRSSRISDYIYEYKTKFLKSKPLRETLSSFYSTIWFYMLKETLKKTGSFTKTDANPGQWKFEAESDESRNFSFSVELLQYNTLGEQISGGYFFKDGLKFGSHMFEFLPFDDHLDHGEEDISISTNFSMLGNILDYLYGNNLHIKHFPCNSEEWIFINTLDLFFSVNQIFSYYKLSYLSNIFMEILLINEKLTSVSINTSNILPTRYLMLQNYDLDEILFNWVTSYWKHGLDILEYFMILCKYEHRYTDRLFDLDRIKNVLVRAEQELNLSPNKLVDEWNYLQSIMFST